ncbi:MAG: hypothetical protein KatS3mg087_1076 [Patescibacteria group bacterium]|nr:MAG: hypothetical protein KatS3mg087_1076 [Patescibacteria group bacterium]
MTDPIEAPVVGVKYFSVWRDDGFLVSHSVRLAWPPARPPRYVSRRGFFFWAFPLPWLPYASPSVPPSMTAVAAVATVRVLPHDTAQCCRIDSIGNHWPDYAPQIPRGVDAVCARNMVGIARAIEILDIRLISASGIESSLLDAMRRHYGVPVSPARWDDVPRLEISDLWWEFWDCTGALRVYADYWVVTRCHPRERRSWGDHDAREFAHRAVRETITKGESR